MSIKVTNFKWEKGKNDLEYIELLENNLDVMLGKFRECSKVAREQYNKGYTKGRADEQTKVLKDLYASDKSSTLKELLNIARAEARTEFAEWLTKSDYANGYFDTENGFVSIDKVIAKYDMEYENGN